MQKINIPTPQRNLSGNLFFPSTDAAPFPVVVVTGSWTSVKEQMPKIYAQKLANKGYAALTFDFRGWGESKGLVEEKERYIENPTLKIEDIETVFEAIKDIPKLDSDRVSGLGICASAGYMSQAVGGNDLVKSVALVAPWLHDKEIVEEVYGGREGVQNLIQTAQKAEASTEPMIIEAASSTNEKSLMYQAPYYTETNRGLIEAYDNKFNLSSWDKWLAFDAIATASKMDKPLLLAHSEAAAIPQGAKAYLKQVKGNPKSLWIEGATQFDFYDVDAYVDQAVDAAVDHFNATFTTL